ncbi:rhamnogalacturonan lyase [Streptomyces sp. NBC_01187]|uniref:rhamnogalacturonan lyase n=1 Tax=Streptomyces sp. NBC_01187 TaxID=2903766 RepID=UPI00386CA375|nr:rhamnogalacturonan lyase [Streptomyces sp. NBC_01187]
MTSPHSRQRRLGRSRLLTGAVAGAVVAGGLTAISNAAEGGGSGSAADGRARAGLAAQVEALGRGAVSVPTGEGNLVSWRLLGTDPDAVAFNVYRGGTKLTEQPVEDSTNFLDKGAESGAEYTVAAVVDGKEQDPSKPAKRFTGEGGSLEVPIKAPKGGDGYTYEANDASVGDLDGDGDLDLVLKWQPTNAKDNSQSGVTGSTVVDAYTLEGDQLWRIDLGRNIRSGAHYTQFQVYDYDGDGRAEVAMKTADGTKDGAGKVIGDADADHRDSGGYVLEGPEFLTMFNGKTGSALDTVDYVPGRGKVGDWGDDYGNRVDRFLAGTAYLDGEKPSLIMSRGMYTRSVVAAWDFDGTSLKQRWVFDSDKHKGYGGQGSHSLSIADADQDGKDEVVFGSMAVDDDGSGLWSAGTGHGDAQHIGDLDPRHEGLEYFKVSEDSSRPGSLYLDPANGEKLWDTPAGSDNGRGVAADITADNPGPEMWSAADGSMRDAAGDAAGDKPGSINFLSWWDGDPTRELLDGTRIDKYGDGRLLTAQGTHSNNGSKANPSLSGDILGDWREELALPTADNTALRIYSTPHKTDQRITTLLHDPMYRTGLAWQNTGYNQPPHTSFFLGDGMKKAPRPKITTPHK